MLKSTCYHSKYRAVLLPCKYRAWPCAAQPQLPRALPHSPASLLLVTFCFLFIQNKNRGLPTPRLCTRLPPFWAVAFLGGARSPESCVVGSLPSGLPPTKGVVLRALWVPKVPEGMFVLSAFSRLVIAGWGDPDPDSVRARWDFATFCMGVEWVWTFA